MLAIDNENVTARLGTIKKSSANGVALFLFGLVWLYVQAGKKRITIYLDNARVHKKQMKATLAELIVLEGLQVEIEFVHIPPYSPYLNAAEYFIHLIRQKYLRHLPPGKTIEEVTNELMCQVDGKQLLTPKQMTNIIRRIKSLPQKKSTAFNTEWE